MSNGDPQNARLEAYFVVHSRSLRLFLLAVLAQFAFAAAMSVPARADDNGADVTFDEPFMYPIDSCTGEALIVTGFVQTKLHTFTNEQGSHATTETHFHGIQARAILSGTQYVLSSNIIDADYASADFFPFTSMHDERVVLTRTGEVATALGGDDLYTRMFSKVTFNNNGEPTADHFLEIAMQCR